MYAGHSISIPCLRSLDSQNSSHRHQEKTRFYHWVAPQFRNAHWQQTRPLHKSLTGSKKDCKDDANNSAKCYVQLVKEKKNEGSGGLDTIALVIRRSNCWCSHCLRAIMAVSLLCVRTFSQFYSGHQLCRFLQVVPKSSIRSGLGNVCAALSMGQRWREASYTVERLGQEKCRQNQQNSQLSRYTHVEDIQTECSLQVGRPSLGILP